MAVGDHLFAAQRIEKIKEIMQDRKTVNVMTLSTMLKVSDVTVRKDLDQLEMAGFLIKSHGGAVLVEKGDDSLESTDSASITNLAEKEKIAELAASTVEQGEAIFIGPGPLCLLLAKNLKERSNITIITNNIGAALELSKTNRNVFLVGGEIEHSEGIPYITGYKAIEYLEKVYVSKAYLSVFGIDIRAGFAVQEQPLLAILKKSIDMAKKTCILAEHTDFDKVGLFQLCQLDDPEYVITSSQIGSDYKEYFFRHDIKLLTTYDV